MTRHALNLFLAICLAVAVSIGSFAQGSRIGAQVKSDSAATEIILGSGSQQQQPKESILSVKSSRPYVSLQGRFSIALPEQVPSFHPVSYPTPNGTLTGRTFDWPMAEGEYHITYADKPSYAPNVDTEQFLDLVLAGLVQDAKTLQATELKQQKVRLSTYSGRKLQYRTPSGIAAMCIYMDGPRMYQVLLTILNDQSSQAAAAIKVLDTFKILTPAEIEAAFRKKLDEAVPKALPQQPVVKKLRSDAEDDGLKGSVKIVDEQETDSGVANTSRENWRISYYNRAGNLTRREEREEMEGNFASISVFGYLVGERVEVHNSIDLEYGRPVVSFFVMAPSKGSPPPPERDDRYFYKIKYQYDSANRLVQKDYYYSDGKPGEHYAYRYSGIQVEDLYYDQSGSLRKQQIITLDENGLEKEVSEFNVKTNQRIEKYFFTYEFDGRGNWIKRTKSRASQSNPAKHIPVSETHRSITYY